MYQWRDRIHIWKGRPLLLRWLRAPPASPQVGSSGLAEGGDPPRVEPRTDPAAPATFLSIHIPTGTLQSGETRGARRSFETPGLSPSSRLGWMCA